jgi:hypothetical protein
MIYRLLTNEEKIILAQIHPTYCDCDFSGVNVAGAVDDHGKVRGLAVLNFAAHCEPIWIENGAPVDFRRVVAEVEKAAKGIKSKELWAFAPNPKIARMAEICGFKNMGWSVFRKELI